MLHLSKVPHLERPYQYSKPEGMNGLLFLDPLACWTC